MSWLPKKESKFFFIVIVILLVIIFIPHIVGLLQQDNEQWYLGGMMFRVYDTYIYYSWMEQARHGQWGFYQLILLTPQKPNFFHPLWLVMGKFGAITNISNLLTLLIFQAILIITFALLWWNFIKYFFSDAKFRRYIFIFTLFTGGFFTPLHETSTFLILYSNPMHILSLIFFLGIIWLTLKFILEKNKWSYAVWSGVLSLLMFLNHFYDTASLIIILTVFIFIIIWKKLNFINYIKYLLIIGLITLPGIVYYIYLSTKITANVITPSPGIWFYLLSYGFLLILALLAVVKFFKNKTIDNKWLFIIFWFIIQLFIVYIPLSFNRRLALGISLPMTLLAGLYLWKMLLKSKLYYLKLYIIPLLVTGLIFGNFLIVISETKYINDSTTFSVQPRSVYHAFNWVKENTDRSSSFLANFKQWDTAISGFTGRFSLVTGGMCQSDNWRFKFIEDFYRDNINESYKKQMLKDLGIDYVWYGKYERELGEFNPQETDYLDLVFESEEEAIYQVNLDKL